MDLKVDESPLSTPKSQDGTKTPSSSKFLTPCRRVGLGRKKRPFQVPCLENSSPLKEGPIFLNNTGTPKRSQSDGEILPKRIAIPEMLTPKKNEIEEKRDQVNSNLKKSQVISISSTSDYNSYELKRNLQTSDEENKITCDMINQMEKTLETKRIKLDILKKKELKDVSELNDMILVWRRGCKEALEDLHESWRTQLQSERQTTIEDVLTALNIPCELVQYDPINHDFIE